MFDSKKVSQSFSKAAAGYDEHAKLQTVVREDCIDMAESCWKEGDNILDAGGGTGAFAEEIRQRGHDWRITHLDLSEGMCKVAQSATPYVVNASAENMPFADASFDGIFSSLMLQWSNDALRIFKEMARITKTGGTCIASTFAEGTLSELRDSFKTLDDSTHVNSFANPASLTALAVHSGFKLLACAEETFTSHHADVASLMRSLKAIGASTKQGVTRKGLMTPSRLKKLEEAYRERFAPKKGKNKAKNNELPATWQVLYMLLEKQ